MYLRLANIADLPQLKIMYEKVVDNMNRNNVRIWNEHYPYDYFEEDIERNRLYLMMENEIIVAAFVINDTDGRTEDVSWKYKDGKALYLNRLGVNVDYLKKGIGSRAVEEAIIIAKEMGAKYMRLFVVDINIPAINLYAKTGFQKIAGVYEESVEEGVILQEYGFEKCII